MKYLYSLIKQISFGEDKLFVFSYTKLVEETVCIAKPYYHYFCREDSVMNEEQCLPKDAATVFKQSEKQNPVFTNFFAHLRSICYE